MTGSVQHPDLSQAIIKRFLSPIKELYERMDQAYDRVAIHYGFHCDGCDENCCETRFHHHTVTEYLYLMEGFRQLSVGRQKTAVKRAARVVEKTRSAEDAGQPVRFMCPLNENDLCLVYPWRPMICRLHGLPHELCGPGGRVSKGVGCRQFDDQTKGKPYYRFDRTPLYREMASLEQQVRRATGVTQKLKMTIAEMLITQNPFKL